MNRLKLNIIGCGHVGQTLLKLWKEQQTFQIAQVFNRSLQSATLATQFIGAGEPLSEMSKMQAADVYMIATPDNEILNACQALVDAAILKSGDILFHCSGALSSEILEAARSFDVFLCSVHPVKSFAEPASACETFNGSYCGLEGDAQAIDIIEPALKAIGGKPFYVQAEYKTHYHAASVMVCNYLTALIEVGVQAYDKAGINRDTAMEVMQPMVRGTLNNIFTLGTVDALTGPIARGDSLVVDNQLSALTSWKPEYANLYARLGEVALELSRAKGHAPEEALDRVGQLLADKIRA